MLQFFARVCIADLGSQLAAILQRVSVLLWLQMGVIVVGMTWELALASALFFGGWYASTHPLTDNDRVILRVARILNILTLGLTEFPPLQIHQEGRNEHLDVW